MADLVFAIVVFYAVVFGARRGFYKEVVQLVALLVGISVARTARVPAGAALASKLGVPVLAAEVVAVVGVWVAAFFVTALLGRLLLKKLRGKGVDDRLDAGAEGLADAISGDTTKGPVTLLTDKVVSSRGIFYWSDKLLGALLGLVKGALTGYILFGVALYADRLGYESRFARSVEDSYAGALFVRELDPVLRQFAEYQLAVKVRDMREIARLVQEDPRRFEAFAGHHELTALARDPRVQALAGDPELRAAWERRDLKGLLLDPRVHALLGDPEVREKVAAVDWGRVREAVDRGPAPAPTPR
ncbi:MAG: CvpA family protein [Planctomycetes bacterium]|nr:CvpA family protein [Planctomycetota bacterium]